MTITTRYFRVAKNIEILRRYFNSSKVSYVPNKIRNIGILAHIDAGKTTTTERMLFYSGTIKSMGEVHHGNTVTDFMDQERERGITITSAAVSFEWNDHQYNLIDTPGHIDFTMEVEQSLSVIDGAVVILDGSAGVEAQTLTVWRQCDNHCLPRIIYLNKMDRKDANIVMCLATIHEKLEVVPLCIQFPIKDEETRLKGVVDILSLEYVSWSKENAGRKYTRHQLSESENPKIWEKAMEARRDITDTLSSHDDNLAEEIINLDSLDNIEAIVLKDALRRATLKQKVIPILCGSSYKNVGVQLLMNAITDYLPSPLERNEIYSCFKDKLCARAFKVQHHDQKGVLTFFRVFSGKMTKNQKVYNIHKDENDQGINLFIPYADEYKNVAEVESGNVAVLSGLKSTMCGNLITSSNFNANAAKDVLTEYLKDPLKKQKLNIPLFIANKITLNGQDEDHAAAASTILGIGTTIPDSVFLCSIEPPNLSSQIGLEVALAELQREDPSMRVINNFETGQTVLAGMGELHLEVIKQRILNEYKIKAELGPYQIAYKETMHNTLKDSHIIDKRIAGHKHYVNITLTLYPLDDPKTDTLKFDNTQESASNLAHLYHKRLIAIKQGITSAFLNGPKLGYPVENVGVILHWLEVERGTADSVIAAATTQCIRKILENANTSLLEPIMFVEVVSPTYNFSTVFNDLSKRRSIIHKISYRGQNKVLQCFVPLSELMGYSTDLRTIASGMATFSMEFHSYQTMNSADEQITIKQLRGY